MTVSWDPARELVGRLGSGLDAVWSLLYAAQNAALRLALVDNERLVELTEAGMDLTDAVSELEWARPDLADNGIAYDPGPAPNDGVLRSRETVALLIAAGRDLVVALLRQDEELAAAQGDTATPGESLTLDEVLALARVALLAETAHRRVSGALR